MARWRLDALPVMLRHGTAGACGMTGLEALATARTALKAEAMIYQRSAKEDAARRDGVPLNTYYNLPYEQWAKIRDKR